MLLQTNSYIVPKEKRAEHARLIARFAQCLSRLGCDQFEIYEQAEADWQQADASNRYVQIMRFRDRSHHDAVRSAEKSDSQAQGIVREFCELINFPYQQQQGLFAVGYYTGVLSERRGHVPPGMEASTPGSSLLAAAPAIAAPLLASPPVADDLALTAEDLADAEVLPIGEVPPIDASSSAPPPGLLDDLADESTADAIAQPIGSELDLDLSDEIDLSAIEPHDSHDESRNG